MNITTPWKAFKTQKMSANTKPKYGIFGGDGIITKNPNNQVNPQINIVPIIILHIWNSFSGLFNAAEDPLFLFRQ